MHFAADGTALLLSEPMWVWRRAQADARQAYEEWRRAGGSSAYAAYRSAQDRADSAQDELALRLQSSSRST